MLNSMQIYSHLPVFPVEIPTFSQSSINSILEISSFEVIPVGFILEKVLEAPEGDGDEIPATAEAIEFESYYTVNNMGALFVIFCWLAFGLPLILLAMHPCRQRSKFIAKKATSLQNSLRGKIQLRFLIEGSLDISLCLAF